MQLPAKFREVETTNLVREIVRLMNEYRLSTVESAYALASALRLLGESIYDGKDTSLESVLADYHGQPTFAGALIVHADQIHAIREIFIDGRD